MNIITLDFETYFDDEYTLKKMTTEAYIRDPRFEVHGAGIKSGKACYWLLPEFMELELSSLVDWSKTACLCHHAQFDGLILSHHYGIQPAFWLDTMSMARLMIGNHVSAALASLAKHYGLEGKTIDYSAETGFKGKHWGDMTPEQRKNLSDGCLHDVELTWQIFQKLMKGET